MILRPSVTYSSVSTTISFTVRIKTYNLHNALRSFKSQGTHIFNKLYMQYICTREVKDSMSIL